MLWAWLAVEAFFVGFFLLGYVMYRRKIRNRNDRIDPGE